MYQLKANNIFRTIGNVFSAGLAPQSKTAVSTPHAVKAAYQTFQQSHPEWAASLFDETFLCRNAAPLFANGTLPTAEQLATAWRNQFNVGSPDQQTADIQKVMPVAAVFLQLVRRELRN
ncbi:hypothetical protein [Candidatus Leptofilum sp.]|uniref:hypothetical protein n=1 Tax=Candidatus Leptofilum sp. TaxID=3241576 RepID=UPI003B5AC87A